jgi:hypothetical protein
MPLDQDPQGGGTEADGSVSTEYCSYCYARGTFLQPTMDAKQMQQFVRTKLREQGYSGIVAWFFSLDIPRLKRWKGG